MKNLYVGENFVGDVPLTKKILAALTTGEFMLHPFNLHVSSGSSDGFYVVFHVLLKIYQGRLAYG